MKLMQFFLEMKALGLRLSKCRRDDVPIQSVQDTQSGSVKLRRPEVAFTSKRLPFLAGALLLSKRNEVKAIRNTSDLF